MDDAEEAVNKPKWMCNAWNLEWQMERVFGFYIIVSNCETPNRGETLTSIMNPVLIQLDSPLHL